MPSAGKTFFQSLVEARRIALERRHDLGQPGDPAHRLVADIPHQPELAAGLQHAADFLHGGSVGKPVERLGADHRVDAAVGQRNRLGATRQRPHVRQLRRQLRAHGIDRFHGNHRGAGLRQQARELAGARAEVDNGLAGRHAKRVAQPAGKLGGIFGTPAGVGIGLGGKPWAAA
jgi:hypothetical protein